MNPEHFGYGYGFPGAPDDWHRPTRGTVRHPDSVTRSFNAIVAASWTPREVANLYALSHLWRQKGM